MTTTRHVDSQQDKRPKAVDSTRAAQALGITEDAIRKRIARGTLEGYKEDGRWYVRLTDSPPDTDQIQQDSHLNRPDIDQNKAHMIETALAIYELRARVHSLEAQLGVKDTQIRELHRIIATTALDAAPGLGGDRLARESGRAFSLPDW